MFFIVRNLMMELVRGSLQLHDIGSCLRTCNCRWRMKNNDSCWDQFEISRFLISKTSKKICKLYSDHLSQRYSAGKMIGKRLLETRLCGSKS